MRKALQILVLILVLLVIGGVILYFFVARPQLEELKKVREIAIASIPSSKVANGTFTGKFNYAKNMSANVTVTIVDHQITDITFTEDSAYNSYSRKALEGITTDVLKKQNCRVDVISGATTSSKAYMKAIELALAQGVKLQEKLDAEAAEQDTLQVAPADTVE